MTHFCKGRVSERANGSYEVPVCRTLESKPEKPSALPEWLHNSKSVRLIFANQFSTLTAVVMLFFECQDLEFLKSIRMCLTLGIGQNP